MLPEDLLLLFINETDGDLYCASVYVHTHSPEPCWSS
jgi:hypothetical protein